MKKLFLLTACLFLGLTATVSAQTDSTKFKPGWYINANGGINWFFGENNNILFGDPTAIASLTKNIGFLGRLGAGYQFTPGFGVRGLLGFNKYKQYNPNISTFYSETFAADVIWNLTALKYGYDPNRLFDFSIFTGLGASYLNNNTTSAPVDGALRAGLQGDVHLNKDLALNLIAEMNILTDNANHTPTGTPVDLGPALTLGISYRLPEYVKKAPKPIEPEVVIPVVTEPTVPVVTEPEKPIVAQVDTVVPVKKDTVKPVVPVVVPPVVAITTPEIKESVFYGINKFTVTDSKQQEIVDKIVSYMNANPTAIVTVSGYADNATGTAAVNREVSKRRAVNLANLLISKYNIPAERIQVKWYGSAVQPYKEVVKNRVVIINSGEEAKTTNAVGTVPATDLNTVSATSMVRDAFAQVFFLIEKAEISDEAQIAELNKVADYLKTNPNAQIIVNGYASKTAGVAADYNTELSKKRAVSVANYLIQKCGASTKQVTVRWFGDGVQPYSTDLVKNQLVIVKVK